MKRVFVACAVAVLIAVAGCGSTAGTSSAPDPAALAPPGTLAFATFTIAPQGQEKADFDAAFGKLLGPDPEAKLGAAFAKATSTSGKLDYLGDVKPWFGDSISVAVTRVAPHGGDFALLVASTDDQKAQAAIDKDLADRNPQTRSYRDVSYKVVDDGTANGVVSHFLVAGTEPAFKAVVDAAKDGKSLAGSDQWKASVGNRGDGKVGLAYVDVKGLLQSFAASLPGVERVAGPLLVGTLKLHPFVGTLAAQPNALIGDLSSPGTEPDSKGPSAAQSPLIESLPADSWLAFALPDVGGALGRLTEALKSNPLIALQYSHVVGQIKQRTGVDVGADLFSAIGDLGVFVRGTSKRSLGAGVVVESDHPATVSRAFSRLRARAPARVAKRIRVVTTGERAVAAYGPGSAAAALHPHAQLGDNVLFEKAASLIGQRPTLFVDFGKALELAARSPHHRDDAHFQQALPHLKHVEYVAVGARRDDGLDVLRGVVGLR